MLQYSKAFYATAPKKWKIWKCVDAFESFFQSVFIGETHPKANTPRTLRSKAFSFISFVGLAGLVPPLCDRSSNGSQQRSHCCRGSRKVAVWARPSRKPDKFGRLRVSAHENEREGERKKEKARGARSYKVGEKMHLPVLLCVSTHARRRRSRGCLI